MQPAHSFQPPYSFWPNDPVISHDLAETEAFRELDVPVLVTSGTSLTPIFINTEKLSRDRLIGHFLDTHADDGDAIARHAIELMHAHEEFREDISILAKKVAMLFAANAGDRPVAVSGGMRRDLIFSVPVADMLDVAHITLYKDGVGSEETRPFSDGPGLYVVHVADLLTKGSSVAEQDASGKPVGWAPQVRALGGTLEHVVAVVDRQQGAAERLAAHGLKTHAAVAIDRIFLESHARDPATALAYVADERGWTMKYLDDNGPRLLVPYFAPGNPKLARGLKFLESFGPFLRESGLYELLDVQVENKYALRLNEMRREQS